MEKLPQSTESLNLNGCFFKRAVKSQGNVVQIIMLFPMVCHLETETLSVLVLRGGRIYLGPGACRDGWNGLCSEGSSHSCQICQDSPLHWRL